MIRKVGSSEPYVFQVVLPAAAAIASADLDRMRLLIRPVGGATVVDEDILAAVGPGDEGWDESTPGTVYDIVFYDYTGGLTALPAGSYQAELWMYHDSLTTPRKNPSSGVAEFTIESSFEI